MKNLITAKGVGLNKDHLGFIFSDSVAYKFSYDTKGKISCFNKATLPPLLDWHPDTAGKGANFTLKEYFILYALAKECKELI